VALILPLSTYIFIDFPLKIEVYVVVVEASIYVVEVLELVEVLDSSAGHFQHGHVNSEIAGDLEELSLLVLKILHGD
jgi:hypothetical protein